VVLAAVPVSTHGLAGCNFSPSAAAGTGATIVTLAASGPGLGFEPGNSQPGYPDQFLQPGYDPLFQVDAPGEPVPTIATKWEYDSSFTMLTIGIRDGVKSTDVSKLDAEAVKESLEHARAGTSTTAAQPASIQSIHVVNSCSLTIKLSAPDPLALGQPRLVICDEPVSGPDLPNQATVLDLFIEIQEGDGVAYMFVTHDISVVHHVSHRVVVLSKGSIVEEGDDREVTTEPETRYTNRLMLAAPVPDPVRRAERTARLERWGRPRAAKDIPASD
jgi:hypothetical protein